MGPRLHLSFCACKSAWLAPELLVSMGPRHNLSLCACKTAWLASELLVSICPSPHLWFLHAKERILDQIFKSLCVPVLICGFCMQNSAFWTRISSPYESQTSSVALSTHNCELNTRKKDCIGSSPHLWLCACKTVTLGLELQVSVDQRPHLWFLQAKQRLLVQNNKSLRVPDMTCRFLHVQQRA